MPPDRRSERLARCLAGLVLCGIGLALTIHADLGLAPWDVLHRSITELTGVPIGTVSILVGFAVLLLWFPLSERPGIGTLLNTVLIGAVIDVIDPHLAPPDAWSARASFLGAGIVTIAMGSGLYIGAGLGPGPRDGLMTGIARRGPSIRTARTAMEIAVLAAGIALGGTSGLGIGTIVFAAGIGPLVQPFLRRFVIASAPGGPGIDVERRPAPSVDTLPTG